MIKYITLSLFLIFTTSCSVISYNVPPVNHNDGLCSVAPIMSLTDAAIATGVFYGGVISDDRAKETIDKVAIYGWGSIFAFSAVYGLFSYFMVC